MAITKCPDCKHSTKAVACPSCGFPIREAKKKAESRISYGAGCLLILVVLGAIGYSGRKDQKADDAKAAEVAEADARLMQAVTKARAELELGDVESAQKLLESGLKNSRARSRMPAKVLLRRIEQSRSASRVREVLIRLSQTEFDAFASQKSVPPALRSGYKVLDKAILALARQEVDAAKEARRIAALKRAKEEQERARRERLAREDEERKKREINRDLQSKLDAYLEALKGVAVVHRVGARRVGRTFTATITVKNIWHLKHKQIRLQDAQLLWKLWASIASPHDPDRARIKIVDLNGNKVGGSGFLGGSVVSVD